MAREILPNVVAFDDQRILSKSLSPGQRVYDEELHTVDGVEYRTWNPTKSKLGAFIVKGGQNIPIRKDSTVLYLGAANGTTPSHVSDMVSDGRLVAVEFSPRSFRDLLRMSAPRQNIVPVLADAWRPELYERFCGKVDFLFQDIAQRQQAAIFSKNLMKFKPQWAMLAIKARSVDVAAHPREVYENVSREIEERTGYQVVETIDLGPFEKDHAAIVLKATGAKPKGLSQQPARQSPSPRETAREERPRYDRPREGGGGGGFQRGPPREGGYNRGPPREGGFNRGPPRQGGYDQRAPAPPRKWEERPSGGAPPPGGAGGKFGPKTGGFAPREQPRDDRPPREFKPRDDAPADNKGFDKRRKWK